MEPIFDNEQITRRLNELEDLKTKVEKLLSLSKIGEDVRIEIEEVRMLQSKGIIIPHLEKQFADQIYPKRQAMGRYSKPITESEIKEAQERAPSAKFAARLLGITYNTFKNYAKKYGIHKTKGWPIEKGKTAPRSLSNPHVGKYPINDILDGKHPQYNTNRLKKRLVKEGILVYNCTSCGIGDEWNGNPITLQLDHIDGNRFDHSLDNLRLLCPNCHSQTDTWCGRNK